MAQQIFDIEEAWVDSLLDQTLRSAGFNAAKNCDGETEIRRYSPIYADAFDDVGLTTQLAQLRGY